MDDIETDGDFFEDHPRQAWRVRWAIPAERLGSPLALVRRGRDPRPLHADDPAALLAAAEDGGRLADLLARFRAVAA